MPPRLYISSTCSIVAVNGAGQAFPLGLVDNLRLEKAFVTEGVIEIGSFQYADILIHGYGARYSWGRAFPASQDLISMGLVPSDVTIPQFAPIFLRVIDQIGQREVALIHRGVVETYTIELGGRAKLMSNVSGIACSLLTESELN
jgi:hypothetical protein